jgi:hypothetical protein
MAPIDCVGMTPKKLLSSSPKEISLVDQLLKFEGVMQSNCSEDLDF